jgi:AcrR family transcriptional regulator
MAPKPDVSTERRKQIMDAALTCFTRKGYTNTTMDDIVAESGLSKGALYWYFKSKDDLFTEMVGSVFEDFGLEAMAELEHYQSVASKLAAGAGYMATFAEQCQGLFGLFVEFWSMRQGPSGRECSPATSR